ncbi:MAG: alpha-hydroxy-acid oxidizing protein [Alphaproteobacteria bacterium]|nr:alpha-hydroxy-acid oxidizing protein [Alphaproteobacteria bacterium]
MPRSLAKCSNVDDLRDLARRRLPGPIFHYIDGAADDELTYRRNTAAYDDYDLVPNILNGVADIDMSVEVMGQKLGLPVFCSPTALQRLFHYQGERAVARAAEKFNTLFGVSSLGTVSLQEIGALISTPKMFQFYFHKDRALNAAMLDMAREARFDILTLTVDTITGGNRERDLHTGFTTPPRLTPKSMFEFAAKPSWALNYFLREKFELSQLKDHVGQGSNIAISVGDYFSTMLDQNMNWEDAGDLRANWDGKFCLKGVMSARDARRAVELGADAIMISNHGGRQLDGSRAPFDQLEEILSEVGGEIEVICDGGIRRGTHILKAMALGATACSGGRMYLYALAAAGQAGVEKALGNLQSEIERGMKLMGVSALSQLTPDMVRHRQV